MSIITSAQNLIAGANPTLPSNQKFVGGWRPPIWGNASSDPTGSKARYCLVYQDQLTNQASTSSSETADPSVIRLNVVAQYQTVYNVFDAVMAGKFDSDLRITDYPVQSGQIYSFNAVMQPIRISLDIGMSDAMQSYINGTFTGNNSRSVAAFQLLQYLQTYKFLCTLNTRWGNFPNMLVESVSLQDTNQTYASARFTVTFRQTQIATVANVTLSARPQSTQVVNGGTSSSVTTPQSLLDSNQIQDTPPVNGNPSIQDMTDSGNIQTVAAGTISSNPISSGLNV